ncbi:hypothetical protein OSTOST_02695 [Ostertagia ostertagi]
MPTPNQSKTSSSTKSEKSTSSVKEVEQSKKKKARRASGESLEGLTEKEWEEGSVAKPAELLNAEKQKNAVSVFVGPKEVVERSERPIKPKAVKEEKSDPIVQLVNRVANMVTAGREDAQAEVSVTVTVRPKPQKESKPTEAKEQAKEKK